VSRSASGSLHGQISESLLLLGISVTELNEFERLNYIPGLGSIEVDISKFHTNSDGSGIEGARVGCRVGASLEGPEGPLHASERVPSEVFVLDGEHRVEVSSG
jgi:hypothetical protein